MNGGAVIQIDRSVEMYSLPFRIEEVISSFIGSQDVKNSSKSTYRRGLNQYFRWVGEKHLSIPELKREDIIRFKEDLLSQSMSALTVGSYLTTVRRFYEWCEANKLYPNIAKGVRTPKKAVQFKKQPLSVDKTKEFIQYFDDKDLRDRAIANLLIRTGLRTIEVTRANVEDIIFKGNKRVLMVHGKGRDEKDNFVILTEGTYKILKAYLNTRKRAKGYEPLFVSNSNQNKKERLSTRSISYIAKEGLKAIGLDDKSFTAHSLRHTVAVNILRAGGSLEVAQYTLRHSNPSTTQIYTASMKEELRLQNSGEDIIETLIN